MKTENFPGLIPKLSKRLGLLKRIRSKMPKETFKMISTGLFTSLLIYCIQVYGNVWGIEHMMKLIEDILTLQKKIVENYKFFRIKC